MFVLWLAGDHLELTGPCGPAPWLLELGPTDHPLEVVTRIVREVVGEPLLVHSTSWRRDREAVILSFVVVIDGTLVGSMASLPIARSELARGEATAAPREIATAQVVEHGFHRRSRREAAISAEGCSRRRVPPREMERSPPSWGS